MTKFTHALRVSAMTAAATTAFACTADTGALDDGTKQATAAATSEFTPGECALPAGLQITPYLYEGERTRIEGPQRLHISFPSNLGLPAPAEGSAGARYLAQLGGERHYKVFVGAYSQSIDFAHLDLHYNQGAFYTDAKPLMTLSELGSYQDANFKCEPRNGAPACSVDIRSFFQNPRAGSRFIGNQPIVVAVLLALDYSSIAAGENGLTGKFVPIAANITRTFGLLPNSDIIERARAAANNQCGRAFSPVNLGWNYESGTVFPAGTDATRRPGAPIPGGPTQSTQQPPGHPGEEYPLGL